MPKTRIEFWSKKLLGNVERDRQNERKLKLLGWRVLTVWECELADEPSLRQRMTQALLSGTTHD